MLNSDRDLPAIMVSLHFVAPGGGTVMLGGWQ